MTAPMVRGTARRLGLKLPQPKTIWFDGNPFAPPPGYVPEQWMAGELRAQVCEAHPGHAVLIRFHDKAGKPVFQVYDGGTS